MLPADQPPLRVSIVHGPEQEGWARTAAEFAARGSAVRCVPVMVGAHARDLGIDHPVIDLTQGSPSSPGPWRFTDADGRPLTDKSAAARAVRSGIGHIVVQVRQGRQVLALGRTKARRTVDSTVDSAMLALGPLAVRSALVAAGAEGREGASVPEQRAEKYSDPLLELGLLASVLHSPRLADVLSTARVSAQAARGALTCRSWRVARWPTGLAGLMAGEEPMRALPWFGPKRQAFWADPHVVVSEGQEWLFVEDLDRSTGLGRIRACRFQAGRLVPGEVVLSTDHHLSFPQVYRSNGRWLATAETCAAANPIYTFDRIGAPWRPAGGLTPVPEHLADPVLVLDGDGVPCEAWGSDARLDPDAVFVRYLWQEGAWARVDRATYVDVTRGRAGGNLDIVRGIRAVQDCGRTYGVAAELLTIADGTAIRRLSAEDVGRGDDLRQRKGVHTITWDPTGDALWIDGWHRRPTLFGARLRLRERRHAQECTG